MKVMKKKHLVAMISVGLVFGWVLGYYAGTTWLSVVVLLCLVFASAFLLQFLESRGILFKKKKK